MTSSPAAATFAAPSPSSAPASPVVSVLVRSMDRNTLRDALDSIASQSLDDVEIVVVNAKGGTHSALPHCCGRFTLRLINDGGAPLMRSHACNAALDAARGQWLLFLDDDDTLDPAHLQRLLEALDAFEGARVAYTGVRVTDAAGQTIRTIDERFDRVRLWQANYLPIHAVLFARSLCQEGARFDETFDVYEDWDFWTQLALRSPFIHVPGVSASYRMLGDSGLTHHIDANLTQRAREAFYAKWRTHIPPADLAEATARAEQTRDLRTTLWRTTQDLEASLSHAAELNATCEQRQQHIRILERDLRQMEQHARDLRSEQQAGERAYAALEAYHRAIVSSASWRYTAPLRWLRARLAPARLRHAAFLAARALFRALPVSMETRLRWRHRVMRTPLGRFFGIAQFPAASPEAAAAPPLDKETVRAQAEAELEAFLRTPLRLRLPSRDRPRVSVLLVLFNQAGLTYGCLQSLAAEHDIAFETIIVDNASSDRTSALLDRVEGATLIRNGDNEGFLLAVNRAAREARGDFLLLLNNDAVLLPGSLRAAVQRLDRTPDAAAVGGPILLWDGRLQEAGSIIWNDGSCLGYGRGDDPDAAPYAFVRDVDYCSGAFLMVRRSAFEALDGLDTDYVPAYYEETDLCVRLWERGQRVIYDPAVRIRHFEFASAGKRSDKAIELQTRNRAKFLAKHPDFLARQAVPDPAAILTARQRLRPGAQRILFIDDRVPRRDLGSGFPRARDFLLALVAQGHFVTHYPLQFPHESARDGLPDTIEIMHGRGIDGFEDFFRERRGYYDTIVISRPHNMAAFNRIATEHRDWLGRATIVYDAEALFSLRDIARAELEGRKLSPAKCEQMIEDELRISRTADRVVAVSEAEAAQYRNHGHGRIHVLGHVHATHRNVPGFESREGYLFVGAVHNAESPNGDSLVWFLRDIWPLLRARGASRLDVVGLCESDDVRRMAADSSGVWLHGRVDAVEPFYDRARVFIVPTRFAAGIPHKAHEAAAHGVPMVVTSLIARQLGWHEDVEIEVADRADAFAEKCRALHDDEQRWQSRQAAAFEAIERDCSATAFERAVRDIVTP